MKVLLISPMGHATGGIARWTYHLFSYYNSLLVRPCQLVHFETARSTFIPDDISFWPRLRLALKDYSNIIKRLKGHLVGSEYDLAHITSSASWGLLKDLLIIHILRKKGIKVIIHFRFGRIPVLSHSKNWEWKLLQMVIKRVDKTIVIDGASYETLVRAGFNNIELLPNPLAPKVSQLIEANSGVVRVPRTILFVGHCVRPKGVYELVEACKSIPNIRLKMVGAILDDVKADLKKLANNEGWLEIEGDRPYEEVIREMLSCDVFVLPTYTEGFPNVIIEAMACGCAIVTTPVGAIPEMLEDDDGRHYGLLVEPQNVNQLNDAIAKLLSDDALKIECRNNVKQRVHERYNMPIIWENIVTIWKEVAFKA